MDPASWREWMPISVRRRPDGCFVEWCFFAGLRAVDPFFQQTLGRALGDPARMLFRRQTSLELLADLARESPGIPPTGFIFHLSRCGSTLVSRLLASSARHLVFSEPPVIDELLQRGPRSALRGLVSAMGQPRNGEERLFIKFDSWHVRELPAILEAFPGVPWIFLYRDPVEILVSQRRMVGTQMVPGLIEAGRLGLDPAEINPAELTEYATRVLVQLCRSALEHAGLGRSLFVNYRDLPEAIFGPVARHFGLTLTPAEEAAMRSATEFDAKTPSFAFSEDTAAKQREAGEGIRRLAETWLAEPYAQLEAIRRGQMLSGANPATSR